MVARAEAAHETKKPSTSTEKNRTASLSDGMKAAIEAGSHLPSLDDRIKIALECECVKPLRETSCKAQFDDALTCFMKADEKTRASDCADAFVALHQCMVEHAEEFSEFTKELAEHKNIEGPAKV